MENDVNAHMTTHQRLIESCKAKVQDGNYIFPGVRDCQQHGYRVKLADMGYARKAIAIKGMLPTWLERTEKAVERVEKAAIMAVSPPDIEVLSRFGLMSGITQGAVALHVMLPANEGTGARSAVEMIALHAQDLILTDGVAALPIVQRIRALHDRVRTARVPGRHLVRTALAGSILDLALQEYDDAVRAVTDGAADAYRKVYAGREWERYHSKPLRKLAAENPEIPIEMVAAIGKYKI